MTIEKLFTRSGREETPTGHDEKGRPFVMSPRSCGRCGGAGRSDRWKFTGLVCFDCNGSGKHKNGPIRERLYTAEEIEKLDARAERARAKRQAAHEAEQARQRAEAAARRDAFRAEHGELLARADAYLAETGEEGGFVADVYRRAVDRCELSEEQVSALVRVLDRWDAEKARKAATKHIGTVGERLRQLPVTVSRVSSFERPRFGAEWQTETVWITTMRDAAGNNLVAKGRYIAREGAAILVTGTVKAHDVYRDEAQTVLQRVVFKEA